VSEWQTLAAVELLALILTLDISFAIYQYPAVYHPLARLHSWENNVTFIYLVNFNVAPAARAWPTDSPQQRVVP
jgi:hypothetical protein